MEYIKRVCCRGIALPAFTILLIAPTGAGAPQAGQYEQPPSYTAAQVLPANLLRGASYTIASHVGLDNFQYTFNVNSQWGTFTIKGRDLLRVRLREIAATAKLAEIGGAETTVGAAGRTALQPLNTAKDLVTEPGKTIGDTFRGVGHIFGSADAAMKATDPRRDSLLASVTGGATARRKLAFDLGVDPNTSFPPLEEQLKRLATANALGQTGANAGLAFVTGGAGIAISVGGTSDALREALRDKPPAELEKDGRQILVSMGISEAAMNAFYGNPNLTPTDKAIIVEALKSLGGAGGREIFLTSAAKANSIEMGFFYRRQAELIAAFSKRISPVRGFVRLGGAPMLETAKGTTTILPVDYLFWSPPLEGLAAGAGRGGEMWITGTASQMATGKLAALGWTVVPKADAKLGQ
jgi:hypothetical protein